MELTSHTTAAVDQASERTAVTPHGRCGFCGAARELIETPVGNGQTITETICPNCTQLPKR
jgi:hypothetical protein